MAFACWRSTSTSEMCHACRCPCPAAPPRPRALLQGQQAPGTRYNQSQNTKTPISNVVQSIGLWTNHGLRFLLKPFHSFQPFCKWLWMFPQENHQPSPSQILHCPLEHLLTRVIQPRLSLLSESHGRPIPVALQGLHRIQVYKWSGNIQHPTACGYQIMATDTASTEPFGFSGRAGGHYVKVSQGGRNCGPAVVQHVKSPVVVSK